MALSMLADQEIANSPPEVLIEVTPGTLHIRVRPLNHWAYLIGTITDNLHHNMNQMKHSLLRF